MVILKYFKTTFFILLFATTTTMSNIMAQNTIGTVKIGIDTNQINIGDQFKLHITAQLPKNHQYQWPIFDKNLTEQIEIISKSKIDTTLYPDFIQYHQSLTLTSFDSGKWVIPSVTLFETSKSDSIKNNIHSDSLYINVFEISVDTTLAIKDIKDVMDVPFSWKELLPWIYITFGILLLIIAGIYIYRKLKNNEPLIPTSNAPSISPYQWAMIELSKLEKNKLCQTGKHKEYYSQLTDILRHYLDLTENINAMEMTTDEILTVFRHLTVEEKQYHEIKNTLTIADLVKFAKMHPLPDDNSKAFACISSTIEHLHSKQEMIKQSEKNN